MSPRRRTALVSALLAALSAALLAGCAGVVRPRVGRAAGAAPVDLPHLQQRALLLLLVDAQRFEPVVVERAARGDALLREEAAVALGRVGDPRGGTWLRELVADAEPAVRRAAAFALGELDYPPLREGAGAGPERTAGAVALRVAAADPDPETGSLAVEALGKLGVAVADATGALGALPEPERWRRLLPHLFRFDEPGTVRVAEAGLAAADSPELYRAAAYALARNPRPEGLPRLRELANDADPRVRAWSARALGLAGDASDLDRLAPLLADATAGAVVQALRAGGLLAAREPAAAAAGAGAWGPALRRLFDDPRPQVRLAALEAAAPWVAAAGLGQDLRRRAGGAEPEPAVAGATDAGSLAERAAALVALAVGGGTGGEAAATRAVIEAFATSPHRRLRQAAATAAAALDDATAAAVVHRLLADPDPAVRGAALSAALPATVDEAAAAGTASAALRDDRDPGVRAVAFGWLTEHPVLAYGELTAAAGEAVRSPDPEVALAAVEALAARGAAVAAERGGVVAVLEQLAAHREWLVRRRAAGALGDLGRPVPAVPGPPQRAPGVYQQILLSTASAREVEIATDSGVLSVSLDCPRVPLTCLNFLQLAEQGFFDGLAFHRVVPDFVVQDGDPRGDGYGGPGYAIRDEISPLRYARGTLGMALAGPDTGGSQFFLTLAPQPHLDGGYTAFGRVVAGEEVLDRILPGTVIQRIREVAPR